MHLSHEPVLLAVGDFLVIQDELHPADVIHVIAGPDRRTDYAIQLYKRGYAKQLFFTGGWCETIQGYHGERGFTRSVQQGVPPQAIAVDESSVTSTYSEAVRLKAFIDRSKLPIHSITVVSDPPHMRRTRWAYREVLPERINIQMAPVPFELSPYQRRWWTEKVSRQMVWAEYLKIVYYSARYGLNLGPITDWLASLDRE